MKNSLSNLETTIKEKEKTEKQKTRLSSRQNRGSGRSAYDLKITGEENTAPKIGDSQETPHKTPRKPKKRNLDNSIKEFEKSANSKGSKKEEYELPKELIRSDIENKINEK